MSDYDFCIRDRDIEADGGILEIVDTSRKTAVS